ncbi:MAG TPA: hypothetical protein VHX68_10045 [Planctomycetaceae bacterium]|jgi:hypothetical protein|nr:hypothetical protein [Planctomycetaceae bacterium]
MHNPLRSPGRFLPAAAIAGCVLVVAFGSIAARAGDDDDLTDQAAAAPRRNVEFAAPEQPPAVDRILFGNAYQNNEQQKLRLDWLLVRKVGDVARASRLTELQKQKLLLAGRGDLVRLIDRMEELKARYRSAVLTPDMQNELDRKAGPIRAALRGSVFADGSLFAKTMTKTLTSEQVARYERIDWSRRLFQHRAGVHMTVLRLATALGLSDDQWQRLEQLLLTETHPAQIIGEPYPAAYFNIVYRQMRQIPEKKLKPLFEPWQWRTLQKKFVEGQRFGAFFEQGGIFLDPHEAPAERARRLAEE